METGVIKSELRKIIDNTDDINVLRAILTLLKKTKTDPVLKSKLTGRAEKSEADIKADRLFTKQEVIDITNNIGK